MSHYVIADFYSIHDRFGMRNMSVSTWIGVTNMPCLPSLVLTCQEKRGTHHVYSAHGLALDDNVAQG